MNETHAMMTRSRSSALEAGHVTGGTQLKNHASEGLRRSSTASSQSSAPAEEEPLTDTEALPLEPQLLIDPILIYSPDALASPQVQDAYMSSHSSMNERDACEPKNPPSQYSYSSSASPSPPPRQTGVKRPKSWNHTNIERRYRNNINDKIAALRDAVPALRAVMAEIHGSEWPPSWGERSSSFGGMTHASRLNKATVLTKAHEYISELEQHNMLLERENYDLRSRVAGFEMLMMMPQPPLQAVPPGDA